MLVTAIVFGVLILLLILLAMRMPVALSLALSGALGLTVLKGTGYTTSVLGSVPFTSVASFSLTIIPMFILMGMVAMRARIAEQVFTIANFAVRKFPGGLGVATVMACAGFSAVSGSSIGTAATMSKLSVNEMRAYGYPAALATGIVASAGTLGVIIPPSTFLVLFAIMTGESIAQILAAGIIPGLLTAVSYILYIMFVGYRQIDREKADLQMAVAAAQSVASTKTHRGSKMSDPKVIDAPIQSALVDSALHGTPKTETIQVTGYSVSSLPWRGLIWLVVLFAIILGGMFSGVFTTIESAAMASFFAIVILLIETRKEGIREFWIRFKGSLLDTAQTTSMVFMILVGSSVLSTFLIAAHVPDAVTNWVSSLSIPPLLTMALLLLMLIPLGTALDEISVLIITVPILYPVAMELGFDGIWLGLMIVKLTAIGMITPPVGMTCFVVSGTSGVKTETVFKGVTPFFGMDMVVSTLLFLVPGITLFLPKFVAASAG